jgi:hypothetical protein
VNARSGGRRRRSPRSGPLAVLTTRGRVRVSVCQLCAAIVVATDTHQRWHHATQTKEA